MSNADHTITGSTPPGSPQDDNIGPFQSVFNVIFYIFLLVLILKSCAEGGGPSAPTQPPPPKTGFASFESANSHGIPALSIILGGGSYEFVYTTTHDSSIYSNVPDNLLFTADFNTGVTQGDPREASVLVLTGSIDLSVGTLSDQDSLDVNILSAGARINAHFKYSQSPRGPPHPIPMVNTAKKTIIIRGELKNVNISGGYGSSTRTIGILELSPSEFAVQEYRERHQKYEIDMREYDAEMVRRGNRPRPHR